MAKIYKHQQKILISSGNSVLSYDLTTGTDRLLVVSPGASEKCSKEITSLAISPMSILVVSTKDKNVIVYDQDFQVIHTFSTSRMVNKVYITASKDIIVADKTGDVYLYKFKEDDLEPKLLLGHQSIILDFILTECEKYIITCDRDEKIRVSHFPNCYNIASFCLGHKEFVTAVKVVQKDMLISASGDGTIRFWNFLEGRQLNIIDTNKHMGENNLLEKFIEEVNEEKIIVSALPVTCMEVHVNEIIYIASSVHSYSAIQIYSANLDGSKAQYLTKFCYDKPTLFLLIDSLYVFSDYVSVFDYKNGEACKTNVDKLQKVFEKYKGVISIDNYDCLSVLYKRKFDNVQEYLERKKQRLEVK